MEILVTGGAGYIGSVMTRQLIDAGYNVVVYDNLSNGNKNVVDKRAEFIYGDLKDKDVLAKTFSYHTFHAVIHFAGVLSVGESMKDPGKYFTTNTSNTIQLLEVMKNNHVKFILFSSTAGVYGNPSDVPIKEEMPAYPTNPYAQSKYMIEQVLRWYQEIYSFKTVSLRYFNAAGASFDGVLGERHKDETHIIPLAIKSVLDKTQFTLFGTDYNTKDGTCVRDYIHVEDLCNAHLAVLEKLMSNEKSCIYNVGTGKGYSNREILAEIERVSGQRVRIKNMPRRVGDPEVLIADASRIQSEVGWKPRYSNIQTIIKTAWKFHKRIYS